MLCYGNGCKPSGTISHLVDVFVGIIMIGGLLFCCVRMCDCFDTNHNNITIGSNHRSLSPNALSRHLETTQQHIENFNLQTLSGNTSLRNATDSTEQQLPAHHSLSISRAITTSIEESSSNNTTSI